MEVNADYQGLQSSITQTASSIRMEVNNNYAGLSSSITQTASSIMMEVNNNYAGLNSAITQTASSIRSEVNSKYDGLSSSITQQKDRIDLVVEKKDGKNVIKSASIVTAINGDSSEVIISADHLDLDGYVTASELDTWIQDVDLLNAQIVQGIHVRANSYEFLDNGQIIDITDTVTSNPITSVKIDGPTNNTYKLQYKRVSDTEWQDAESFSRATSLSGVWSGNTYTVTASPQGNTNSVSPVVHTIGSQGSAYMQVCVATPTSGGSGYEDHGNKTTLYLVTSSGSRTAYLKSANSTTSGEVYAQTTISDSNLSAGNIKNGVTIFGVKGTYNPHPNSFQIKQTTGYTGATKMKLYFTDNTVQTIPSGFHAAGDGNSHAWYYSDTNMNWTSSYHYVYYGS